VCAYQPTEIASHPDLVHDFGASFEDPQIILTRLTRLICGQAPRLCGCTVRIEGISARLIAKNFVQLDVSHNGRTGKVTADAISPTDDSVIVVVLDRLPGDSPSDDLIRQVPRAYVVLVDGTPDHYSLHPYSDNISLRGDSSTDTLVARRRGRMIHNHPCGMHVPVKHVSTLISSFPRRTSSRTCSSSSRTSSANSPVINSPRMNARAHGAAQSRLQTRTKKGHRHSRPGSQSTSAAAARSAQAAQDLSAPCVTWLDLLQLLTERSTRVPGSGPAQHP